MAGQLTTIAAKTASSSYDILIGDSILPDALGRPEAVSPYRRAVLVSSNVYNLHKKYIDDSLAILPDYELYIMDDGEENKNYHYAEEFLEKFITKGMNRRSIVIGIGGGVVGDFAGYLSAVYMRGIPVIQVPTTLLAMVDSSIGGKVAVNLSVGKNIIGAFHQPRMVVSDVRFLETLPEDELKNGLSEAFKHGLIGEAETLEIFKANNGDGIKKKPVLTRIVELSASFKSGVVERDEREGGLRAILNYGHTIGHAIESVLEYKGISHGEAVALGIRVMVEISRLQGLVADRDAGEIADLIEAYGLAGKKFSFNADELISHMYFDKKNTGKNINFVVLHGIGNPRINQHVDRDLIERVLKDQLG